MLPAARMTLKDPILTLVGKDAELLHGDCRIASVPLTPGAVPTEAGFTFEPVDASRVTVGLIGSVDDLDPQKADRLLRASSGLAAGTLDKDLGGAIAFALTLFLNAAGEPIEGVEVVNLDGKKVPGVIYPDAALLDVNASGATAKHGAFVVPEAMLKSFSGRKAGYSFPTQQAASSANGCFLLTPVAQ